MSRIHPECPDSDPSDRSVAADVLRQEPDEEEDEEEDEGDGKEDDEVIEFVAQSFEGGSISALTLEHFAPQRAGNGS
jgi:hypothetical protein